MVKVPATPPDHFVFHAHHLRQFYGRLWRIFRTEGNHPTDWDELRHYGPVAGMRFDPHPHPEGVHPDVGVMYAATDPVTVFGEVYYDRRLIARSEGGPTLVAWEPTRPLNLLDLTTDWPVLNGAAAAMMMIDDKARTQAWSRALVDRHGVELDGLYSHSSITNQPMVTLFSRTVREPAFPPRPLFRALLSDATADSIVLLASQRLGYKVLR